MSTLLIFTVGTNPLPLWVAWENLKNRLQPPVSKILLLHSENTEDEAKRLKPLFGHQIESQCYLTSSGDPAVIRRDVGNCLKQLPEEISNIHVHYTGGTKAMAVATVAEVENFCRNHGKHIGTSYLDPRGGNGPQLIDQAGLSIADDPRKCLDPNLGKVAHLNGFQVGPFQSKYYGRGGMQTEQMPAPIILTDKKMEAGRILLEQFSVRTNFKAYTDECLGDNSSYGQKLGPRNSERDFKMPTSTISLTDNSPFWTDAVLPVLNKTWPLIPWDIETRTLPPPQPTAQTDMVEMVRFLNGIWLEYAAYDALQTALQNIGNENFAVRNSAYIRRMYSGAERKKQDFAKYFEVDVIGVLGYQLLNISCSLIVANETDLKRKAMEALVRGRQLGGDEARVIMFCAMERDRAQAIEEELHDEVGSSHKPLQVWGRNTWGNLAVRFEKYLREELRWV